MIIRHPSQPCHPCQVPDSIWRTFLKQFVLVFTSGYCYYLLSCIWISNHLNGSLTKHRQIRSTSLLNNSDINQIKMFQANLTTCVYKEPWTQWWKTLSKKNQRMLTTSCTILTSFHWHCLFRRCVQPPCGQLNPAIQELYPMLKVVVRKLRKLKINSYLYQDTFYFLFITIR